MNKTLVTTLVFLFCLHTTAAVADNPKVKMETSKGDVVFELYPDKAPKTVANFLGYVTDGNYDGTIFHRVIKNFMNQGGGFTKDLKRKPTKTPVLNEADNGLKNLHGTIAMARTSAPHSATNQFFINTANNSFLDHKNKDIAGWGYTVFGKVIHGMEVMDKIASVKTGPKPPFPSDVPVETVEILRMTEISENNENKK